MNQLQKVYSAILADGRRSVPTHDEVQKDLREVERTLVTARHLPY
jgi:hypothetical protein